MFTGIVVDGTIKKASTRRGLLQLEIESPRIARELEVGDSVSVNGVCLTAVSTHRKRFGVNVIAESLTRSTLGDLKRGHTVNLELPTRMADRLGGHLVQGHVDGLATVARIEDDGDSQRVWFGTGSDLLRYMVPKGSVTLDGASLTLVEVGQTTFQVALIPHTLGVTTLGRLQVGTQVNVEVDVIAKYVERLAAGHLRPVS